MDIFASGFIAQISYLEDKIAKNLAFWGNFGRILGNFLFFLTPDFLLFFCFSPIKSSNSSRKSIKIFFGNHEINTSY
jgi:hypothetical protein